MTPDSSQGNPDDTTHAAADLPSGDGSPLRPTGRASDLREGQLFGDYHLIRRLGRGGFGEVWEAESVTTQRRLALKVLTAAHQSAPDMVARFQREGRLAASVNHTRCVFTRAGYFPRQRTRADLRSGPGMGSRRSRTPRKSSIADQLGRSADAGSTRDARRAGR